MPWTDFVANWSRKFSPLTHKKEKALRIFLGISYTENNPQMSVEKGQFDLFLDWFGPISSNTIADFWKFTYALMLEEYFHAEISAGNARDVLRSGPTKNNNYVVRLNSGTKAEERNEPFIITYRIDSKTFETGFRVNYGTPQKPSEYVAAAFKDKGVSGLSPCNYSRTNLLKVWPQESEEPVTSAASAPANVNKNLGYIFDVDELSITG